MKTLSVPLPHRTVLATVLAVGLVALAPQSPPLHPDRFSLRPVATTHAPAQPVPPVKPAQTLPFSMADVVAFLSRNFHLQPVERGSDFAIFSYVERQPDGTNAEIMRIAVEARAEQFQVAFTFCEFNTMHYVAEFIEGPLFTRSESEQLYGLLYAPSRRRDWQKVGRFFAKAIFRDLAEGTEARFDFASNPRRG